MNIETTKKDFQVVCFFSTRELLKLKRIIYPPMKYYLALQKDKSIHLSHDLLLNCMSQLFWKNFVLSIYADKFKLSVTVLEITIARFLHS